jgi:EPSP synthase (3-phosphoshikimate 1-carboxyvinyltransferase)
LEIQPAKEIQGSLSLPPSSDLFFIGIIMALAAKVTARISPLSDIPLVPWWEKALAGHVSLTCDAGLCTVVPKEGVMSPITLSYDDLRPYRDFVVFCLLGLKKTLIIDPLPGKRLDAWAAIASECGCTLRIEDQGGARSISLTGEEHFRIRDTLKTADVVHPLLGLSLGLGQQVAITTDTGFSSPVRHIAPVFGYEFSVTNNLRDNTENPLIRRMRFIQLGKKFEGPLVYTVKADFSKRRDASFGASSGTSVEVTVPGDDVLCSVLIAAKCVVPRGGLIIENAGLESWNTQALSLVKKMGGVVATQESGDTSFGSVGTVSIQKLGLSGRKVDCDPIFTFENQLPAMVVIAAYAHGQSVFRKLGDLRSDEPDGIEQLLSLIRSAGIRHGEMPDGIVIDGGRQYDGFDLRDHLSAPLAAAGAAAALHCMGKSTVNDEAIVRRWPRFSETVFSLCVFRE